MDSLTELDLAELEAEFEPVRGSFRLEPGQTETGEQYVSLMSQWQADAIGSSSGLPMAGCWLPTSETTVIPRWS